MAIIVDAETRLVVQGLTGREGSFHGLRNRRYGTQLVAGVTPGKGGQDVEGVPVYDTVADAVEQAGANTTMIFVPALDRAAEFERKDLQNPARCATIVVILTIVAVLARWRSTALAKSEEAELRFEEAAPPVITELGLGISEVRL